MDELKEAGMPINLANKIIEYFKEDNDEENS